MKEIHGRQLQTAKVKVIARQYFWRLNLDKDIEFYRRSCSACLHASKAPEKAELIKFKEAIFSVECVYSDTVQHKKRNYILAIDGYSCSSEVAEMQKINSDATVVKSQEIFARFGLLRMIFSDNGRQFTSDEFQVL
ncbi:uncharacterized protein LOC142330882 [Lycorma delicatula]|uniref:uncharacterized protein LOC142330882 n=1 Tax=Lycorma delicatula TaxID=130591 RepID=UPI003F50ED39